MAKWLVSCSNGCGKKLKRGPRSRPDPICRACRRRGSLLLCEYCLGPFRSKSGRLTAKYCSVRHAVLAQHLNKKMDSLPEL